MVLQEAWYKFQLSGTQPIGEQGCCKSSMAARRACWTDPWWDCVAAHFFFHPCLYSPSYMPIYHFVKWIMNEWMLQCVYLSTYLLSINDFLIIYLPIYLYFFISRYIHPYLFLFFYIYLLVRWSTYVSIPLSVYVSTFLSLCQRVCLPICQFYPILACLV